jgi:hypothetical protein
MDGGGYTSSVGGSPTELVNDVLEAILAFHPELDIEDFKNLIDKELHARRAFHNLIGQTVRGLLLKIIMCGFEMFSPKKFVDAAYKAMFTMYPGLRDQLNSLGQIAKQLTDAEEQDLRKLLTKDEWDSLHVALMPAEGMDAGEVAIILNSLATDPPWIVENAGDLFATIRALEETAAPEGSLPIIIQFLSLLAVRRPAAKTSVWAWIDQLAPRLGVSPESLKQFRAVLPESLPSGQVYVGLGIEEQEDRQKQVGGPRRYRVSRWLRQEGGRISHKRDEVVLLATEQLMEYGQALLGSFERILASIDADAVAVEFLLSHGVMNLYVDRWRIGTEDDLPRVGDYFSVVVRSADRLRMGWFHAHWKKRWRLFQAGPLGENSAQWMRWNDEIPASGDLVPVSHSQEALSLALTACKTLCCLGLKEGYGCNNGTPDEVAAAIHVGIPILIWRRDRGDVGDVRRFLATLASQGRLDDLPHEIIAFRQRALDQPDHPGNHLTLLWDDYDQRQFMNTALQPPIYESRGRDDHT